MPNFINTPNMNLPNPVPTVDPGPDYAYNLQASLNKIDQHNHSPGQGVQITPNGININADLPFNGNNATTLRTVRFLSQATPITNAQPDVGCLYVAGNELWYNDYTGGNQIQITSNGNVNATSSGISSGTASASFAGGVLVVKSSSTSYANVYVQDIVLANGGNLSNQLTLQAAALTGSYTITFPSSPPSFSIPANLTMDSSGDIIEGGNVMVSASSGTVTTNLTGGSWTTIVDVSNFVSYGRPIMIVLQGDGTGAQSNFYNSNANPDFLRVRLTRNNTQIFFTSIYLSTAANFAAPSILLYTDVVGAGTYEYKVQFQTAFSNTLTATNMALCVYEI